MSKIAVELGYAQPLPPPFVEKITAYCSEVQGDELVVQENPKSSGDESDTFVLLGRTATGLRSTIDGLDADDRMTFAVYMSADDLEAFAKACLKLARGE